MIQNHPPRLRYFVAKLRLKGAANAKFFAALAEAGINIDLISTSEIRISTVLDARDVPEAVRVVHKAFDLDAEEEAIVYGGTGR